MMERVHHDLGIWPRKLIADTGREDFALARAHFVEQRHDERHRFDAETRLDRLDLGDQQLGEMAGSRVGLSGP